MLFYVINFVVMASPQLIEILKAKAELFHPVIRFDPRIEQLVLMDFSENNKTLTSDIFSDTKKFIAYVNDKLSGAGAKYGIGGYGEHRTVYSMSPVFDAKAGEDEPRRLHLGIDIWGKPNTPVMAPLDGIVHSFGFHDCSGDYGATIILTHILNHITFYTLYGHLSLNSLKNLREGSRIEKGEVFADFGIPSENGGWPPHLHFQVIADIGDYHGDYPGVCRFSEREKWLSVCPDPDLILRLNKFL